MTPMIPWSARPYFFVLGCSLGILACEPPIAPVTPTPTGGDADAAAFQAADGIELQTDAATAEGDGSSATPKAEVTSAPKDGSGPKPDGSTPVPDGGPMPDGMKPPADGGISGGPVPCATDADCPTDPNGKVLVCTNGTCAPAGGGTQPGTGGPPPCTTAADCTATCPAQFTMGCACAVLTNQDGTTGSYCVPACGTDADCPPGKDGQSLVCHEGVCGPPTGGTLSCVSDGDCTTTCPPGSTCTCVNGACAGGGTGGGTPPGTSGPPPCTTAAECTAACPAGFTMGCTCAPVPKPDGSTGGICLAACGTDAECPTPLNGGTLTCEEGACQMSGGGGGSGGGTTGPLSCMSEADCTASCPPEATLGCGCPSSGKCTWKCAATADCPTGTKLSFTCDTAAGLCAPQGKTP
jgi:hypothetical protein